MGQSALEHIRPLTFNAAQRPTEVPFLCRDNGARSLLLRCVNGFLNLPHSRLMQKFTLQRGADVADALLAPGHPRLHPPPARIRTLN